MSPVDEWILMHYLAAPFLTFSFLTEMKNFFKETIFLCLELLKSCRASIYYVPVLILYIWNLNCCL
jgi:hypothetical protein